MNFFNRTFSLSLALVFIGQIVSLPAANATERTREERREERKAKAEERFFKKFDKKFETFAMDVEETVSEYSEEELNEMYFEYIVWLEQHGNYEMARAMITEHDKGKGSIRSTLLRMVSEEARVAAKASLKAAIAKAGGFNAFIKSAKIEKRANLDMKCRVKKIGSLILIAPISFFGVVLGASGIGALVGGVVTGVVLAEVGIMVAADGFAMPWFVDNIAVGCYNEYKHPGFPIYN